MSAASYQHLENATVIHQRSYGAHAQESPRLAREAVAALANHFWRVRGCPIGSPEVDWYLAERELRYLRLHS